MKINNTEMLNNAPVIYSTDCVGFGDNARLETECENDEVYPPDALKKDESCGMHKGHRQRVKKSFIENGVDSFSTIQLLEALLFYSIARKDTNETAHNLINRFGNFMEVMEAPYDELIQVNGINESSACLIRLTRMTAELYGDRNYDTEFFDRNMRNHSDLRDGDPEKMNRIRKKAALEGLGAFSEVQILEILLSYAVPCENVYYAAYELMETFGNFSGVLNAAYFDLLKMKRIGENAASMIYFIRLFSRRYLISLFEREHIHEFREHTVVCAYCEMIFLGADSEWLYLLLFDRKLHFSSFRLIGQGSTDAVGASIKHILQCALKNNCEDIIVVHNHPDGFGKPSLADITLTKKIFIACKDLGINMHDHIIVGRDGAFSVRAGLYCLDLWGGI